MLMGKTMAKKNAINLITNGATWAIDKPSLETVISIANRENEIEALLSQRAEPLDNTYAVSIRGGVAIMPITGILMPRANLFAEISGAVSVEMLGLDLGELERNDEVTAVVLKIHSQGGATTLINEFSQQIKDFKKPIVAYVEGTAASAAYWLASAADKIILDATAIVGSIGVVAAFSSNKNKKDISIVSSHAPDKRPNLETDAGRSIIQKLVDDTEAVFIETIMANRNMSHEQVISLRGGVLVGAKAINAGFADELGSLESVINTLKITEDPMDLKTLKADHSAVYDEVFAKGAESAGALSDSQKIDAELAATLIERERIGAIIGSNDAKGRETQAQHIAFKTDMSANQAVEILKTSPAIQAKSTGKTAYELAMEAQGNPDVSADADGSGEEPDLAAQIIANGKSAGVPFHA